MSENSSGDDGNSDGGICEGCSSGGAPDKDGLGEVGRCIGIGGIVFIGVSRLVGGGGGSALMCVMDEKSGGVTEAGNGA